MKVPFSNSGVSLAVLFTFYFFYIAFNTSFFYSCMLLLCVFALALPEVILQLLGILSHKHAHFKLFILRLRASEKCVVTNNPWQTTHISTLYQYSVPGTALTFFFGIEQTKKKFFYHKINILPKLSSVALSASFHFLLVVPSRLVKILHFPSICLNPNWKEL